MILKNNSKRLITGPHIPGENPKHARWLPGANPLDARYWKAARGNHTIKILLREGVIAVDEGGSMPDPDTAPSAEELAKFSDDDLTAALTDASVPVQWHPALEAEIARRDAEPAPGLTGHGVKDALPMIAAETDTDKLEAWASADSRKSIASAIADRLEALALEG